MRLAQILMFASGLNFSSHCLTSHTILVNDGNLNKMQMATKCFHLLVLLIMCFVRDVEGDKDEIERGNMYVVRVGESISCAMPQKSSPRGEI